MVKNIIELNQSPWSGHSALMGKVKREWQKTRICFIFFWSKSLSPQKLSAEYVQKGVALGRRPELVGGGLVRSLGGWSEVLALRGRGEKQRSDQRILGDSEFVQDVICGLDDLVKKNLRLSGQRINIAALAQQVCKKYNISLGELRSGSRRRDVAKARGSISWIAVRELGYSGADVARYLGVTNSCVTRIVASGQKPDVDDLIKKL